MEIEAHKSSQTTWLVEPLRRICILTCLGHRVGRGWENCFLPLVLTGLNRLAETSSDKNWQKLNDQNCWFSGQEFLEIHKCVSGCYWELLHFAVTGYLVGNY